MFYSADLLRRKTALGAIWIAAHGKKLAKGRIMQVNISETCNQIMDPEVPHALRLQAILASGVCIVYNKQSSFLLEDCHDALKRVSIAEEAPQREAANDATIAARPGDIDMDDVGPIIDAAAMFAVFPTSMAPHQRRLAEEDEDLILMPSIPEAVDDRKKKGKSPAKATEGDQDRFLMGMEIMDVPDLPEGVFDFPMPGEDGYLGPDMFPMPDDFMMPEPFQADEAPAQAPVKKVSHRRRKKALVDKPEALTIPDTEFEFNISTQGRVSNLLVNRPRPAERSSESDNIFSLGPAIGKWPEELCTIWEQCNSWVKPANVDTPPAQGEERGRGTKRNRLNMEEEALGDMYMLGNAAGEMDVPPMDDFIPVPADDYGFFPAPENGAEFDAFGRRSNDGSELPEFEAERLRAALNGTPGGGADYKDAMFQLGLTPSEDLSMSGSRRGRFSNASLREFRGGRLSEKSSDPGSRRLADMLEDLQAAEGDLAAALPTVGEEDTEHGRFRPGVLSQFSLLEESGPSMPPTQLSGPMEQHVQTLEVLTSLRSLTPSHELSLTQATLGLSRMEAAQVFSHILVGRSKGFISANQERPYGDITVTFAA